MPMSSSRLTSLTAPKTPRRTDLVPTITAPLPSSNPFAGRAFSALEGGSNPRQPRPGATSRLLNAGAAGAELQNDRTRFDMDLDRERLDLERTGAEFDRSRTSALDQFEQTKYGDTKAEKQARLAMEQASHAKDLEARDRQAKLTDDILALARGDASPMAPVSATTSTPQQLGILTSPAPGAAGVMGAPDRTPPPVSDGTALGRTQVQDRAAERTSGALRALEGEMINRGILGSNLHGNRIGDVVAGQAGDLLDADVEFALADEARAAEIADRDAGFDFQRQESALDRDQRRRLSLLDLLQGLRY